MSQENQSEPLMLNGEDLTLEEVAQVARDFRKAVITPNAIEKMKRSRTLVDEWVSKGKRIYGINTGFGSLQEKTIPTKDVVQLQKNIILSHAAAVGDVLPEEI